MKFPIIGAFAFALFAAIGNAIFVYGQRKSVPSQSPFIFLIMCLIVAILSLGLASIFFPKDDMAKVIEVNYRWAILTGIGIAITYVGFYFLYNRYGATYYILYAILAFITTSVVVGIVLLRESFNVYYILSVGSAILTLILFFLGKRNS